MADSSLTFYLMPKFKREVKDLLTEAQLEDLIVYMNENPHSGDVIPGAQGCRKLRWAGKGKGKRGGTRVIYFYQTADGVIWLMRIYAKNQMENIPTAEILRLRKEIGNG